MKKIIITTGLLLAVLAVNSLAGHHETDEAAHSDAAEMSEEQMMALMAEVAKLGEPHAKLAESVGSYTAEMLMFMGPDATPTAASMSVERTLDLEGRILHEVWRGEVMGSAFVGQSRTGYDNVTKRYWSTWNDNWSTGIMVMYGDWDDEQQAMVFTGEAVNPISSQPYTTRSVGKHPAPGKETMVMYEDQGQGEYKSMSFTLTRN